MAEEYIVWQKNTSPWSTRVRKVARCVPGCTPYWIVMNSHSFTCVMFVKPYSCLVWIPRTIQPLLMAVLLRKGKPSPWTLNKILLNTLKREKHRWTLSACLAYVIGLLLKTCTSVYTLWWVHSLYLSVTLITRWLSQAGINAHFTEQNWTKILCEECTSNC